MTNTKPKLSVVPMTEETTAQRVRRLQEEAKHAAADHIGELQRLMADLVECAEGVSTGGDAYPPGAREIARQVHETMGAQVQSIDAILWRQK